MELSQRLLKSAATRFMGKDRGDVSSGILHRTREAGGAECALKRTVDLPRGED